jgi:hypothetical protein
MQKIPTIFNRDWQGNRGVVDQLVVDPVWLGNATATEKLDGTNVRLTVRANTLVRLEKRRNPTKAQKDIGIEEPWYVDANESDPSDKYLWDAARATDLNVPDGEWSGEAIGPKIQGNPLGLDRHTVVLFGLGRAPVIDDAPTTYDELREWLPRQASAFNNVVKIEGIVWHGADGSMAKIKTKDFK